MYYRTLQDTIKKKYRIALDIKIYKVAFCLTCKYFLSPAFSKKSGGTLFLVFRGAWCVVRGTWRVVCGAWRVARRYACGFFRILK